MTTEAAVPVEQPSAVQEGTPKNWDLVAWEDLETAETTNDAQEKAPDTKETAAPSAKPETPAPSDDILAEGSPGSEEGEEGEDVSSPVPYRVEADGSVWVGKTRYANIEALAKAAADKEAFIRQRNAEIGELRQKATTAPPPEPPRQQQTQTAADTGATTGPNGLPLDDLGIEVPTPDQWLAVRERYREYYGADDEDGEDYTTADQHYRDEQRQWEARYAEARRAKIAEAEEARVAGERETERLRGELIKSVPLVRQATIEEFSAYLPEEGATALAQDILRETGKALIEAVKNGYMAAKDAYDPANLPKAVRIARLAMEEEAGGIGKLLARYNPSEGQQGQRPRSVVPPAVEVPGQGSPGGEGIGTPHGTPPNRNASSNTRRQQADIHTYDDY